MNIRSALRGVIRLYFDTAPLIYYVEENEKYIERMQTIVGIVEQYEIEGISSVITIPEVLKHPLAMGNVSLESEYREILEDGQDITLLPVTLAIANRAAHLRATYNLRTPDALHVATAIESGCDAFLTNDAGIKRMTELRILLLDELELDTLDEDP